MTEEALKRAITEAVFAAIKEVGLDNFKKTSFFMSNHRTQRVDIKIAA